MQEILVVDDDRDFLELVRNLMERDGITVRFASSGEEALRHMSRQSFHLMITDLNMPGIDGIALAGEASVVAPNIPIVLMTGSISPEIPRLAEQAGIARVLAKPFRPEEMLEVISAVVGERGERGVVPGNEEHPDRVCAE